MASKEAMTLSTKIILSVKLTAAVATTGGSYAQEKTQPKNIQLGGTAVEFLAGQIDVAAAFVEEMTKKGQPPSKKMLGMILTTKLLGVGDFSDKYQCEAAIGSLTLAIAMTIGSAPTGPGGWIVAGANLLSELYAADVDCGWGIREKTVSAANKAVTDTQNSLARFLGRMEYEIVSLYGANGSYTP